ncbi:MAG: glycosyltransferase family 39 protein [Cyclobacteriaceae bacterium]|nr:glycosyltransferase family 39 protein [Cyclobacteriaceae bacterium]
MQDKKWIIVMGLSVVAITANFWGFPVYILDEAKNAACAMEMLERGDWVVPTFNNVLRTDKPPLHYFFMMASYSVFGYTPFAARLFSVIMGLLTVAVVYRFARKMEGEQVAYYAGLILSASLFVIAEFHLAVPDPYFIFFLTLSWLSFAYAWESGRVNYYYVSYAAAALAFLAKGPVAVVLSAGACGGFLLLKGELSWGSLRKVRLWQGMLLFLALAAPWWIAVAIETQGEWVRGFIWEHNVGRFSAAYEDHANPPGMTVLLLLVAMLPLSGYLPRAMMTAWKERRQHSLLVMALVSVAVVLVFFSVSRTLLPNYVGPAVPFAALLMAKGIERQLAGFVLSSLPIRILTLSLAVVLSALVPVMQDMIAHDKWISGFPGLAWLFLPLSAGAWLSAGFAWQNHLRRALATYLLSFWLTGVLFFYLGVPTIMSQNPVARSLPVLESATEEIVAYRFFNAAYVFNLRRTFVTSWDMNTLLRYVDGRPVIILTRQEDREALEKAGFRVIFEHPYLFEGSTALVFTNR